MCVCVRLCLCVCRAVQVIRFSRLFGPGRASSIPRTWKDIAVPRKRSPRRTSSGSQLDESQSEGERDESAAEKPKETGPQQDNGELVNGVEVVDAAEEKIEEPKKPKRIDFWVDESGRLRFGCRPSKQERDAGEEVRDACKACTGLSTLQTRVD